MSEEKKPQGTSEEGAKDEASKATKSPGRAPMGGGGGGDTPMGGGSAEPEKAAGSKVDHVDEEDE